MIAIKRAFLSASDKSGLAELARGLSELGVELWASGGTARFLRGRGIEVQDVAEYTGYPQLIKGRVKTLHPLIHAGILAQRDDPDQRADIERYGIKTFDLVVVNLYPFEAKVTKAIPMEEAMELVDIGGEALIRAAAKNHQSVGVLVDPADYGPFLEELRREGGLREDHARRLAEKAFNRVIHYNAAIADYLAEGPLPPQLNLALPKTMDLRAGENKHQRAALYDDGAKLLKQLHGKALTYNNLLDLDAALRTSHSFARPTAVVVKHANPCGLASADSIEEAFRRAYQADEKSAFGGIVGLNRPLTEEGAELLAEHFLDAVVAPGYDEKALEVLKRRKGLRVIEAEPELLHSLELELHATAFGVIAQEPSSGEVSREELKVVGRYQPTEEQWNDLIFAWRAVRWVKSNAILLARDEQTVGIGAGQMSRVDAVELAIHKAGLQAAGTVMASDAFFPFRDSIDLAAAARIKAIIEPGGSIRDEEVIRAADDQGIPLVFTGRREFRH